MRNHVLLLFVLVGIAGLCICMFAYVNHLQTQMIVQHDEHIVSLQNDTAALEKALAKLKLRVMELEEEHDADLRHLIASCMCQRINADFPVGSEIAPID